MLFQLPGPETLLVVARGAGLSPTTVTYRHQSRPPVAKCRPFCLCVLPIETYYTSRMIPGEPSVVLIIPSWAISPEAYRFRYSSRQSKATVSKETPQRLLRRHRQQGHGHRDAGRRRGGTVAVPVNMAPKWDSSGEAGHFKTIRSDYTRRPRPLADCDRDVASPGRLMEPR